MGYRAHTLFTDLGSMEPGLELVPFVIDTTTSGTIKPATTSGSKTRVKCGVTITRTAAGRYLFTFDDNFTRCFGIVGVVERDSLAGGYTAGKGAIVTNGDVTESTGLATLQVIRGDTNADADVEDAAVIRGFALIQVSSARG